MHRRCIRCRGFRGGPRRAEVRPVPRRLRGRVVHRRRERGRIRGPRRASVDCGQLVGPVGGPGPRLRVPGRWSAAGWDAEASPVGGAPEALRLEAVRPPGWHREVPPLRGWRWWMDPDPAAMAMGRSQRGEPRRDGLTRPLAGQFGSRPGGVVNSAPAPTPWARSPFPRI
jgi:hypothetical protein